MTQSGRVLILLTQVYFNGGIQRFNRTLLSACERAQLDYDVYSLADDENATGASDSESARVRGFARRKGKFIAAVAKAVASGRYRTVVVGHIHLLGVTAALCFLRPWSKTQLVMVAHGTEVWGRVHGWQRIALRMVARVLCVSSYTRRSLLDQVPGLDPQRLVIFPNALLDSWVQRQGSLSPDVEDGELRLPPKFVLSVGRLTKHDRTKGIVHVIEALPELPADVHHVIAGTGEDMDFLRETAARLGVADRVHLIGTVSDRQLAYLYRNCLAFVLPSSQEGFGIVFIEAMFFGAVVIAASEKGAVDVVKHEETGLLVEYARPAAVTAAVMRILNDETLRWRLRQAATATVTEQGAYTFAAFAARTQIVLNFDGSVVADRSGALRAASIAASRRF